MSEIYIISEKFWNFVLVPVAYQKVSDHSKLAFAKHVLRWDIFEESFIAFLINKMDLSDPKLEKLSIFNLITLLYNSLSSTQGASDPYLWPCETFYNPTNDKITPVPYYKGSVVTKETWIKFTKNHGLRDLLI